MRRFGSVRGFTRPVSATIAICLLITSLVVALGDDRRSANALQCADVVLVGVRGSGETASSNGGFGTVVGAFRDSMADVIDEDLTLEAIPIDYPSLPVSTLLQIPLADGVGEFLASATTGAQAIESAVADIATQCADSRIVLAGHSQGALAIHWALHQLTASEIARIASIDLFSDPARLGSGGWEMLDAPVSRNGIFGVLADVRPDLPETVRGRARSWCYAGDAVCDFSASSILPTLGGIHSSYAGNVTATAAQLVSRSVHQGIDVWLASPTNGATSSSPLVLNGGSGATAQPTVVNVSLTHEATGEWWTGSGWSTAETLISTTRLSNGTWTLTTAPDRAGPYQVSLTVIDAAGKRRTRTDVASISLDPTTPRAVRSGGEEIMPVLTHPGYSRLIQGDADLSSNGDLAFFATRGQNVGEFVFPGDVWMYNRADDSLQRITNPSGPAGSCRLCSQVTVDASGNRVAFVTKTPYSPADLNTGEDLYVLDRTTNTYTLASALPSGNAAGLNCPCYARINLSSDGTKIVFSTSANGVVAGDTNGLRDVFVRDLVSGTTARVSTSTYTMDPNGGAFYASSEAATLLYQTLFQSRRRSVVTVGLQQVLIPRHDAFTTDSEPMGASPNGLTLYTREYRVFGQTGRIDLRAIDFDPATMTFSNSRLFELPVVNGAAGRAVNWVSAGSHGVIAVAEYPGTIDGQAANSLRNRPIYFSGSATTGRVIRTSSYADSWVGIADDAPFAAVTSGSQTAVIDLAHPGDVNGDGVTRVAVLGDSYISGEGAADLIPYEAGTDQSNNKCHRTRQSWAYQTATALGSASTDVLFVACSGAVVKNLHATSQFVSQPPQLMSLASFQASSPTDVVFLSIGGNDVGFEAVVMDCVLGARSCVSNQRSMRQREAAVDAQLDRIGGTLRAIKALAPGAEVWISTYPAPLDDPCVENGFLTVEEIAWLENDYLGGLNRAIRQAAMEAGVNVFELEAAAIGHEVCSSQPFVHGGKGGNDILLFIGRESFHPTWEGHRAFAALAAALASTSIGARPAQRRAGDPRTAVSPSQVFSIELGPGSTAQLVPGFIVGQGDIQPASPIPILQQGDTINLAVRNAPPQRSLSVVVRSVPQVIAQPTSASDGSVVIDLPLPSSIAPGEHRIEIIDNVSGAVLGSGEFMLEATGSCPSATATDLDQDGSPDACDGDWSDGPTGDADTDSVVNSSDNCPIAINPTQSDVDGDGVGDLCDPDLVDDIAATARPLSYVPAQQLRELALQVLPGRSLLITPGVLANLGLIVDSIMSTSVPLVGSAVPQAAGVLYTPPAVWSGRDFLALEVQNGTEQQVVRVQITEAVPPACASISSADLVGVWSGDGTGAATNGPPVAGNPQFSPAMNGEGFEFTGIEAAATAPFAAPTTALTVEGWIRPVATGRLEVVASKWSFPSTDDSARTFMLAIDPAGAVYWAVDDVTTRRPAELLAPAPTIFDGEFHHVAAAWDGTASVIYVDGTQVAREDAAIGTLNDTPTLGLAIGSKAGLGDQFGFSGLIDELGVYGRSLTGSEISAIYAARETGRC